MQAQELDALRPAEGESLVFDTNPVLNERPTHYCPGCHHGIAHRLIAEVVDELGWSSRTIGATSVGCSAFISDYIAYDWSESPHGRACAEATGIKRARPDRLVLTYQGDGDLAAIGTAETIHACNRGENIAIIFINNGIYGMTGGQMAPTTLKGMKSSTSPNGREIPLAGHPLNITELLAKLDGTCYVTRQAVHTVASVKKCKRAIQKALENSMENKGTSIVEIVSTCSSGWKMNPAESNDWMVENMFPEYPMGDLKNI